MAITDITHWHPVSELLATSGQPSETQLAELSANGYQLIINLALHDDPRYSLKDEPGTVAALGMDYIHIPVPFDAPTVTHLKAFFAALQAADGRKTLIHCAHNKRVAVFLALHRVINLRWSRPMAMGAMNAVWPPEALWRGFFDDMLLAHASVSSPFKQ